MADANRPVTGYPAPNQNGNVPPASNTGYPYAAPPPHYYNQQYYPQTNYQNDPYAARRANFLRRIFGIMIAAVIITGTIMFIVWLVLRPRLPEFRVDSLSVSAFNLSNNQLTGTFDLHFTVGNPNKKIALAYDNMESDMFYRNSLLSSTNLPPFTQATRNETSMRAEFAALSSYVEKGIADDINGERGKSGNVVFNVRMLMTVRFKAGIWRARRRLLKVFCGDLAVALSSNGKNGSLNSGPRQCRVGL